MKNLYYCLTSMLLSIVMINMVNAQGLRMNSGYLVTKSGYVNVNGAIHNSGTILGNTANIYLSGDWNNPGTFTPGTSTIVFNGSGNQTVSKASGELFKNLSVSKSGGSLLFQHFATISGNLQMNSGMVNTQGNILFLTGAGQLVNEHSGSYVLGIVDVNPSVGSGSSNFSGCGVTINSGADDIGIVNFRRYNGPNWRVTVGAHSGINRLWQISSTSPPSSGRTLTFSWLADDDNGRNLSQAQIWKSTNNGNLWVKVGPVQDASATHSVTLTGETTFGMYTISDASNPLGCVLTCPSDINVNNTPGQCGAVVTFNPQDNGGCLNIASTPASGSFFNVGQTTVTVTASDAIGNTQSCSFTVTVTDNENPTITCPQHITANMDPGQCYATVSLGTPSTSDNCTVASVTSNKPSNNQYPFGLTQVTWTVTDNHGRTATCVQNVTVTDNQYPTITCPQNISTAMDAGSCYATVNLGVPVTDDNCQVASVTSNKPANDQYPFGVTTVTWTVTDNHSNAVTCLQTVTVSDNQNPSISCPANITANMDAGNCFATVSLGTPTVGDNCTVSQTTSNKPANDQYPFGVNTVIWTVTDNHGNTASCAQTVTVNDNQAPTITCPANVTVNMDAGSCFATVTLTNPTTADNCEVSSVTSNKPANNQYPFGTTNVVWTVTDNHGNTASCVQTVTVNDNQPPLITCPSNISANMDQGSCFATVSLGTPSTSDNCTVQSVTSNKPSNDQYPFGVTFITWTVTDNHGNLNTCVQSVTVSDNQAPSITCPANLTVNMDNGSCFATVVSLGSPQTSDNCQVSSVVNNKPSNDQYLFGVNTVIWTVTDNHGNTASCAQTITVNDNQFPSITCPGNITTVMDPGSCFATVDPGTPATSDNCTVSSVTSNKPVNNQYPFGETTIIWTVTDDHGNSSSCAQTVTVSDNQPPAITCPANITANMDAGSCFATVQLGTPSTSDNCVVSSVTSNNPSNNQYPFGLTQVIWTVTDNHGNSTSCVQTVTVNDNQAPLIQCPANITANMDAGSCFATVNLGTPQTSDNCQVASVTSNKPSNDQYPYGLTQVTWTVTDNHGNSTTCIQTVTVNDNQYPVIQCPASLTQNIDQGHCYATVNLGTPATSDNCQVSSVVNNAPVSMQFPIGTTTVIWTVTDNHGNSTTCTQTILVKDNEPPVLVCPAPVERCANPGNQPVLVNGIAPQTAWDRCGNVSVTYTITGVTTGSGAADASGTTFNVGISQVNYTAVDEAGNVSTCSFQVTIHALPVVSMQHEYQPVALCEPAFALYGGVPAGGVYTGPGVQANMLQANLAGPGTYTYTYTYTDIHGCVNSTQFSITILEPVNLTYTVGNNGTFPNLTGTGGLFEFLNTSTVGGNITAQVISDLDEPGTHAMNPMVLVNNCWDFTLTIVPSAAVVRVISGNVAQAMIRLNGADRVTFDGTFFGGKHFLFRNNDNTKPAIQLINGATANQFKGCVIEGANNDAASGLVVLGTSTGPQGNSNNTFNQCIFRNRADVSTLPLNLVYSSGTSSFKNSGNQFSSSEFVNFGQQAVSVTATGNGSNWNISGNSFYFTINPMTAANQTGILFLAGNSSMNLVFDNNYFGGSAPALGGTASSHNAAGTFKAISVNSGDASISGNQIGNITLTNTGAAQFIGIETNGTGNFALGNNVVDNVTIAGTGNFTGLNGNGNGVTTFSGNRISNITYTSATGVPLIKGIVLKKGSAARNVLYNFRSTQTNHTPTIYGISNMAVSLPAPNPIENNMITFDAGVSSKPKVYGLYDYSTGMGGQYRHNTVRLYGPTTTAYWTAAFYRQGNAEVTLYNNILVNNRISNTMAKHYAIHTISTLLWTSNYNDLFTASSTIGIWGANTGNTLLGWKAVSGQDMNSININPVFVSATDLHLTTANSGIDNKGTGLFSVITDIDGSPRSVSTPDMGAHEFSAVLPRFDEPQVPVSTEPALLVYPNPASTSLNIQVTLPETTQIEVVMYSIIGEIVSIPTLGSFEQGTHQIQVNTSDLPAGSYLVRVNAGTFNLVKRLEIIK